MGMKTPDSSTTCSEDCNNPQICSNQNQNETKQAEARMGMSLRDDTRRYLGTASSSHVSSHSPESAKSHITENACSRNFNNGQVVHVADPMLHQQGQLCVECSILVSKIVISGNDQNGRSYFGPVYANNHDRITERTNDGRANVGTVRMVLGKCLARVVVTRNVGAASIMRHDFGTLENGKRRTHTLVLGESRHQQFGGSVCKMC